MTNRERFRAAMAFEPTDRPCHIEHGFWPETYCRWQEEGLPGEIHKPVLTYLADRPDLFDYFGIIRLGYMLLGQYYLPPFETQVLEETETYRIVRDGRGCTAKHSKVGASVPQFLDYPVKCRRDYEALKERLQPALSERYPPDWERIAAAMRSQQDVLVCTHMDGFFAYPRELMGLTHLLVTFYDDPALIRDLINDRCEFYMQVYEQAIRDTRPDLAFIWEDMCFKNGPLISPALFREFLLPAYRKLTDFLKGLGVSNIIVDSDGDVRPLIPLWLEGGVTGLLPFEVKAGLDAVQIGQEFPTLQIIGGLNKHAFERSREAIDAELERVLPAMLRRGGYAVSLDHWVPPQIPLENFRYYVERVRAF